MRPDSKIVSWLISGDITPVVRQMGYDPRPCRILLLGCFCLLQWLEKFHKISFWSKSVKSFFSGTATFSKTWILLYTQQKTVVGRDTDGMLLKRQQSLCRRLDFTSRDLLNNNPGAGFLNLAPHFNIFNTLISLLCAKTISKLWRLFARGCNCVKL